MEKTNLNDVLNNKKKPVKKVTETNVIKTQTIDLKKLKSPKKSPSAKGVKKNIYLTREAYDVVVKVQDKMGYGSISETIQNLILANKNK